MRIGFVGSVRPRESGVLVLSEGDMTFDEPAYSNVAGGFHEPDLIEVLPNTMPWLLIGEEVVSSVITNGVVLGTAMPGVPRTCPRGQLQARDMSAVALPSAPKAYRKGPPPTIDPRLRLLNVNLAMPNFWDCGTGTVSVRIAAVIAGITPRQTLPRGSGAALPRLLGLNHSSPCSPGLAEEGIVGTDDEVGGRIGMLGSDDANCGECVGTQRSCGIRRDTLGYRCVKSLGGTGRVFPTSWRPSTKMPGVCFE